MRAAGGIWRTGATWIGVSSVLALTTLSTGSARADDQSAAVGTASASGVRTSYDFPGYLVVDTIYDAGGPIAQSVVNSSGGGTAFASFPYPGDTVVNAPALANVGTGQAFPFTYPLYVLADGNLTPKATAQDATGSLALTAESAARTATSTARLAGPTSGVITTSGSIQETSVVIGADGVLTSTADSITRGIDVGVLKVGEVHVRTVSVLKPGDKEPTTTATTDVTGVTVLGQPVGVSRDGIVAPGGGAGSPYQPALDALNDALSDAGISVALAGDREVAGGTSNAGLEILQKGTLPLDGSPVGVARTLIGNASSFIVGGSGSLLSLASAGAAAPAATGAGIAGSAVEAGVDPAGAGTADAAAAAGFPLPVAAASAGVPGVPEQTTVDLVQQAGPAGGTSLVALDVGSEVTFFYLVIALGAVVALASSLLWRSSALAKGGRRPWTS